MNGDEMPLKEFIAQVQEIIGKTIVVDQRSRQSNQVVTVLSNVPLEADGVYELFPRRVEGPRPGGGGA